MGQANVLRVQGLEISEMPHVAYVMEVENVGVAKGQENALDARAQGGFCHEFTIVTNFILSPLRNKGTLLPRVVTLVV